ncbi:MAG: hypothetical protein B7X12_02640 [Halothiobacillus sp. 20-53-49]|nr:hypothetical protein [Halothiobacillaceae bacterium]OYV47055.1 MAG: hypothetical protein B7X12_02640 [Halothiobacillus sp. 20-53-49]HUN00216.1 hypothetical protein [Halothiobacillus sp.]
MQKTHFDDKYPVFEIEIPKAQTTATCASDLIARLKADIDAHPSVAFIAVFDHYAHTKSLPMGEVAEEIIAAQNIIFCFGIKLPQNPRVMAVRPRSIGVTEFADHFVVNFMEPPMPIATMAIEGWVKALRDRPAV